jgi:uridylate kinase
MLRAAEINADVVMMAKNIDGVYTADPRLDPTAVKLEEISYMDILKNDMKVIDATAASFGKENNIPLHIFGLDDPQNIIRAIKGEKIGTIVK